MADNGDSLIGTVSFRDLTYGSFGASLIGTVSFRDLTYGR